MLMRELVFLLNLFLERGDNEAFPEFCTYSSFSFSNCYVSLDVP